MNRQNAVGYLILAIATLLGLIGLRHLKNEIKNIEEVVSYKYNQTNIGSAFGWGLAEAKFKRHIEESNVVCIAFGRGRFGAFRLDNQTDWPIMIVAATNHATVLTNPISFRMKTNDGAMGSLYLSGFFIDATGWTNSSYAIKIN